MGERSHHYHIAYITLPKFTARPWKVTGATKEQACFPLVWGSVGHKYDQLTCIFNLVTQKGARCQLIGDYGPSPYRAHGTNGRFTLHFPWLIWMVEFHVGNFIPFVPWIPRPGSQWSRPAPSKLGIHRGKCWEWYGTAPKKNESSPMTKNIRWMGIFIGFQGPFFKGLQQEGLNS